MNTLESQAWEKQPIGSVISTARCTFGMGSTIDSDSLLRERIVEKRRGIRELWIGVHLHLRVFFIGCLALVCRVNPLTFGVCEEESLTLRDGG